MKAYRKNARRRGFTLVELLVVVGILGMLLGIATVGMNAIAAGSKIQSSIIQLQATLSWARQYAITHRENVFVVFPEPAPLTNYGSNTNWPRIMPYQSYGVYVPAKGYIREWQFLPKGVVFDLRQLTSTNALNGGTGINVFRTEAGPNYINRFLIPQPGGTNVWPTQGTSGRMACISYQPNGRLNQKGGSSVAVWLCEGSVDYNNPGTPLYTPNRKRHCMGVRPLTGQIRLWEF